MNHSEKSLKNDNQLVVFISIKPEFAKKIISGTKTIEYRKSPINKKVTHIIIYSTSPEKRIVGIAEVEGLSSASPTATWEGTKHSGGITRKLFREYFKNKKTAYAIKIKNVIPFGKKIKPNEIEENFKVPQSFRYVKRDFLDRALHKGVNN